jgi:hypothetical protein
MAPQKWGKSTKKKEKHTIKKIKAKHLKSKFYEIFIDFGRNKQ